MDDLEDELDLRFHRGLEPDVYYRIPTSESLEGALRNELERTASSLIPSDIVTEFVFAAASTVTVPVTQQASLEALIEPQDYAQSIQVEYALCREIDGKGRLGVQRAISKSIVAAIEETNGFKYSERHAHNPRVGGDGARFRYFCQDSLENKDRKAKKKKKNTNAEDEDEAAKVDRDLTPTYDCGGAIHVKFSIKRHAINVVYKHNPIHRDVESRRCGGSLSANSEADGGPTPKPAKALNGATKKRKRSKKDHHVAVDNEFHDPDLDMSTSPDAPRTSGKKKPRSNGTVSSAVSATKSSKKKSKVAKAAPTSSPAKALKKTASKEITPARRLSKNKACIRCREKKIKCNEAKASCNQCNRGLWTCQYEAVGPNPRSRNGCLNCKQRRRKCTEEKPSCAYCLKVDDGCEYAVYS